MPGHRRRDHEVAGLHRGAFAVDRGERALAFKDKRSADWLCRCAGANVAGNHHLDAGEQRCRDLGLAAQARIFQDQHPPLGLLGGDQLAASVM